MQQASDAQSIQLGIFRIYVKDMSFESPRAPKIFLNQWRPEVKVDFVVKHQRVDGTLFEVVLGLTIEAREGKEVGFIVEVEQAGVFDIRGPEGRYLEHTLRVVCPNIIFPYARQTIDQALVAGGFPPMMLAPINFEYHEEDKPERLS